MTEANGLPTGTVSFLFTDIVGSTALWEAQPVEMGVAVARHDAIVREAISSTGGHVFASGGDGVAAVFARAGDAICAAVSAQAGLVAEVWPAPTRLQVRMGVHSGEADERNGDFFGAAVNRAARVMSVARGGQVLVSGLTSSLAGPLPRIELIGVGERRLRGVTDLIDLMVVRADGVDLDETPPGIDDGATGNLPRPANEFVGNLAELRRRVGDLSDRRLVTLTGAGGVGKTRLAIEVGGLAAGQFVGGVWLVELAPVGDGDAVPAAVLSALGAQPQPGMTVTGSIVDWLRVRPTLLILDNCEHLMDAAAALASAIVAGSPTTTVLATSREPLGVAGEVVRGVASLPVDGEAVQLFTERASAASDRFVLDDTNRASVVAVCARLDGIPLAIELAAARVRTLSPAEILARLDDRFRLLRSSGRGGQERHQTLLAAVTWSVQLLDDDTRCLFERLSVFPGSFDLAAVEQVCGFAALDPLDVLDLLESLVDKSMVVAEADSRGRTRYRLLETLRQFGETRIADSPDAVTVRDRHLAHYTAMAVRLHELQVSPDEAEAHTRLDLEWDNLRAAFGWALATQCDDDLDSILYDTSLLALHSIRWEHAEWAQRASQSWLERGVVRPIADACSAAWALFRGDIAEVGRLDARLDPDAAGLGPRDIEIIWTARAGHALATVDLFEARSVETWLVSQRVGDTTLDPVWHAWIVHHVATTKAISGEDISGQITDATDLARRWNCPSLRAVAYSVIDGGRLNWPGLCASAEPGDAIDGVERLRIAAEQARSVGAVFVAQNTMVWLMPLITVRGNPDDADELHGVLRRIVEGRLRVLYGAYFLGVAPWFVMVGRPQLAATMLGFIAAEREVAPWVDIGRVAEARLLIADFVDRDEFERVGASIDLDTLGAHTLRELEQIANERRS